MMADLFNLDTTPGCGALFAPPSGFAGDYLLWVHQRFHTDPGFHQHFVVSFRMGPQRQATGPFAGDLDMARRDVSACFSESLDTTPGQGGRFAPPNPQGSYLEWLKGAYRANSALRDAMTRIATWTPGAVPQGPYADSLSKAIARMIEQPAEAA